MKHLFVPYEIALKLKEKGFDENYLAYYYPSAYEEWNDELNKYEFKTVELRITKEVSGCDISKVIPAPLYQQVIDWLFGITGTVVVYNPADIESVNKEIIQCLDRLESIK